MSPTDPDDVQRLANELRESLEGRYGPLLGGANLVEALGYRNVAALRQARRRGHVAVTLFSLPKRRGYFALTRDVAEWLARAKVLAVSANQHEKEGGGSPANP